VSPWPWACALVSPWPSVYALAGAAAIHESVATHESVVTDGPVAIHESAATDGRAVTRGPVEIRGLAVTNGPVATNGRAATPSTSGLPRCLWGRLRRARLSSVLPCQPAPRGRAQPPEGAWPGSEEQRTSWRDLSVGGDVDWRGVLRISHQQREYKHRLAACQAAIFNLLRTETGESGRIGGL